jgi:hypothetical protein
MSLQSWGWHAFRLLLNFSSRLAPAMLGIRFGLWDEVPPVVCNEFDVGNAQ